MKYSKYPSYKDSEVKWLGKIPEHWETKKTKYLFNLIIEPAHSNNDYELLSIYTDIGVKPRKELEQKGNKASSTDGYWKVKKNDIIVNKLLAWMGAIGISEYEGVTSPAYDILRANQEVNSYFYSLLFRTKQAQTEFKKYSRGIMEMRLRLYFSEFGQIHMPFPSLEEQETIVNYLNKAIEKIDLLIKKQMKLRNILKEKRQAKVDEIIHDENTLYQRLGYVVKQQLRPVSRQADEEYESLGVYNRGRGLFHKPLKSENELGDSDFYWVQEDDLILSGQFAWEGSVALASKAENNCIVSHRYPIIQGKENIMDTEYLWAYFTTRQGDFILNEHSVGSAGRNRPLNINTLLKEKIPVPPIEEQREVAKIVKAENKIKILIDKAIVLLKEKRTALITSAVTGKIDVREAI